MVERFTIQLVNQHLTAIVEDPNGAFVRASDYDALAARVDRAERLLRPIAECDPDIRAWLGMPRWPIAPAPTADLERDAMRYRWLKEHNEGNSVEFELVGIEGATVDLGWDANIDAAMRAADSARACPLCGRTGSHSHTSGPMGMT
jgi:hypothetical protein